MKKIISPFFLLVFVFACTTTEVKSLRGDADLPAGSNPTVGMDWQPKDAAIARTFVHQPPLIPHAVAEYSISTAQNDCLDCHGDNGRLDWQALGYAGDPMRVKLASSKK